MWSPDRPLSAPSKITYHTLAHSPILPHTGDKAKNKPYTEICLIWFFDVFPFFPDKGVEPLANQEPQDLLAFHLWDDLTAPFLGSHAQQKIVWRENGKRTGHHWSIQVSQTQKGRNMTPTIVGFCPWLASVMGLYGLTVTMRIHQLLTIRKISNHLNHLLVMFSSCVHTRMTKQKAWIPRMQ